MKKLLILTTSVFFLFTACQHNKKEEPNGNGTIEIEFDNIAIINDVQRQLNLVTASDENYEYQNGLGQAFNITFLRYFISAIVLEGPNGEFFEDKLSVDATKAEGYYLIDEANAASQLLTIKDIPAGLYNKISFTVGVEETGVKEGAAGGSLDPATNGMFWNWNSGYVAVKFEGQSAVSAGGANGNSITPANPKGLVFHVGGWKNVEGSAFVNNNQRLSYTFDTNAKINSDNEPHVHMVFDVLKMFNAKNIIDFTGNNNVHKPVDGTPIAENLGQAFRFDHLHQ